MKIRIKKIIAILLIVATIMQNTYADVSPMTYVKAAETSDTKATTETSTETPAVENNDANTTPDTQSDLVVDNGYTLEDNMTVDSLVINGGTVNTNGYNLTVNGDITFNSGELVLNQGCVDCGENLYVSANGKIVMNNQNDYLIIRGNADINNGYYSNLAAGCIEFNSTSDVVYSFNSFSVGEELKAKFLGTGRQEIVFGNNHPYFGIVELKNNNVYSKYPIDYKKIVDNGYKISGEVEGIYGYTLDKDEVIEGDLKLSGGTLNLNGHSLTVTGNLYQWAGDIDVNKGTLTIEGDYRVESILSPDEDINKQEYGYSTGSLIMKNPEDTVNITGNMVINTVKEQRDTIVDGNIRLKGDLLAGDVSEDIAYKTGGNNKITLCGEYEQKIDIKGKEGELAGLIIETGTKLNEDNEEEIVYRDITIENEVGISTSYIDNLNVVDGFIRIKTLDVLEAGNTRAGVKLLDNIELNKDIVIGGNLNANGYEINLNGHSMTVEKNTYITNNNILFMGGSMYCKGDLSLVSTNSNGVASSLVMDNPNDYICIDKDLYISGSNNHITSMTAGTMDIKGNLYQNGNYNFESLEEHTIVMCGDKKQTINIENTDIAINKLVIRNSSAEGVYAETLLKVNNLVDETNNFRSANNELVGWTLDRDEILTGNIELGTGTLNLNGHNLTINGNLIQKGGYINVNGGSLNITGDYTVANGEGDNISSCSAAIYMTNESDYIKVGRNLTLYSTSDMSTKLTKGTIEVVGNIIEKGNFANGGSNVILLSGTEKTISYETITISNLELTGGDLTINGEKALPLAGSAKLHGNKIVGITSVATLATFAESKVAADIVISKNDILTKDLEIDGTLKLRKVTLNLSGHTLTVDKDMNVYFASIYFNQGSLWCNNNLKIDGTYWDSNDIRMGNTEDYLYIQGDLNLIANSLCAYNTITAGTIELKGNLYAEDNSDREVIATGTHRLVLSGDKKQTISINCSGLQLNIVEVKNTSEEGIYVEDRLPYTQLINEGVTITYANGGTVGYTLTEDVVIDKDVLLVGGTMDLNGHNLTIKGNLYQEDGDIVLGGGKLTVEEDYVMATKENDAYTTSRGLIISENSNDYILVKGDYINYSRGGTYTKGTLEVKGEFVIGDLYNKSFVPEKNYIVKLTGSKKQTVTIGEQGSDKNHIANLYTDNSKGIDYTNDIYVTDSYVGNNTEYTGNVYYYGDINNLEETIPGVIYIYKNNSLDGDKTYNIKELHIYDKTLDLKGHKLDVEGDIVLDKFGKIYVDGGALSCNNITLQDRASLTMTNSKDYALIKGDFNKISNAISNVCTEGTLEIKGDFCNLKNSYEFIASGSHKIIFSGDEKQYIYIGNNSAIFGTVEYNNTSAEGIYVEGNVVADNIIDISGNVTYDIEGILGYRLEKDETIDSTRLLGGTMDLNGLT